MKAIRKLIDQLDQIPLNLHIESRSQQNTFSFSYESYHNDRIYGKYYETLKHPKNIWIVLYHGLGAHTSTQGYLEFVTWWTDQGFDVIGIDMRNQGGLTKGFPIPDPHGLYLSGMDRFEHYYYTVLYLDAYRLIDVAKFIKNQKVIVNGGSQGGTLALFTGATHPDVELILADMPSNIDLETLIHNSTGGFKVFKDYQITPPSWLFENIDLLNYAKEIKKPVLLASGTDDSVCPISTVDMFFDQLDCVKTFLRYDHYGHGGYDHLHFPEKLHFIHHHIQKKDK